MKTTFKLLFLILITTKGSAQKPDKVIARVSYNLTHVRDTTQRNFPYTENMLLVIGKNASVYTSFDRIKRDLGSKNPNSSPKGAPFKPITLIDYYFFVRENKFYTREKVITEYLAEENAPKIPWKILKDTAHIEGIKCQKATANFKGRNWIAWFAPDLPFQSGPWKLNGLPGLIIEAFDDKKEVQFQFDGIDNLKETNTLSELLKDNFFFSKEITFPKDAKKTTKAALDQLRKARDEDPTGFMAASLGVGKGSVLKGASINGEIHKVINNPIELPEKK